MPIGTLLVAMSRPIESFFIVSHLFLRAFGQSEGG